MVDSQKTIVIDNGSGVMKAGFADEDAPRAVFPTVVAYTRSSLRNNKSENVMQNKSLNSAFIGDEAM